MDLVDFYEQMFLIRFFEEKILDLIKKGEVYGTVHTCIGQEAAAVGVVGSLNKTDVVFSNHRSHGHYIAKTGDIDGLMAEIMGRATGICGGRGGSQHLCSVEYNFYSNGIQGGVVPNAVGMALAEKLRNSENIVTVFLGDGTLGQGAVYESFNLASLWSVPILFVIENNQYAQSTPVQSAVAGDILARANSFGIAGNEIKVDDVEEIKKTAMEAIGYVRNQSKPFALLIQTYRLAPHSHGDDYRDPQEIEYYRAIDPLLRLRKNIPEAIAVEIEKRCHNRINQALEKALNAPFPQPSVKH